MTTVNYVKVIYVDDEMIVEEIIDEDLEENTAYFSFTNEGEDDIRVRLFGSIPVVGANNVR